VFQNEFYLGEWVGFQIALYVELIHDLVKGEQMADDVEKGWKEFDENFSNMKRETDRLIDRLWEVPLNLVLKNFPEVREPEVEARLAEDLQMVWDKEQQRSREDQKESQRKFREESISNIRKSWAANRKWTEEKLKEGLVDREGGRW